MASLSLVAGCAEPSGQAAIDEAPQPTAAAAAESPGASWDAGASNANSRWTDGFALVSDLGGPRLVLQAGDAAARGAGPLELSDATRGVVHAALDPAKAPASARRFENRAVEVVTAQGARCSAQVGALQLTAAVVDWELWEDVAQPSPSELASAPSQSEPSGTQATLTRARRTAARAEAIWASAARPVISAALILDAPERCPGAPVYARLTETLEPRVAVPIASVPQRAAVLSAFRALPAYRKAQAEYAAEVWAPPAPRRWDVDRGLNLQAFAVPGDADVWVSVTVPALGCSAFDPELWAVFRVGPAEHDAPRLVFQTQQDAPAELELIVDLARDGNPTYVVAPMHPDARAALDSRGAVLSEFAPEVHGCGC